MVEGKQKERVTPKWILRKGVSEYDIYRFYIGEDFKIGKAMHSPMPGRRDNNPSFIVGNRGGFMYHLDMGDSRYRGNAFSFVQQKLMYANFNDALNQIVRDFNLGQSSEGGEKRPIFEQPKEIERPAYIQVVYSRHFTTEEMAYWNQYYLSEDELLRAEVYPVKQLFVNRRKAMMRKGELTFGYKWEDKWKIYRPYACKDRKWINSIPIDGVEDLQAVKQCKKAIVTKSRKDRLVLQKFLPTVCSVQNESLVALNPETISFLQQNCEDVYINYDSDEPGKKNSWAVTTEFDFKHLNVPDIYLQEGIKDFSDLIKAKGPQVVQDYLISKNIL